MNEIAAVEMMGEEDRRTRSRFAAADTVPRQISLNLSHWPVSHWPLSDSPASERMT
jgi:hypothetical protein